MFEAVLKGFGPSGPGVVQVKKYRIGGAVQLGQEREVKDGIELVLTVLCAEIV